MFYMEAAGKAPYEELVPRFDRYKSRVIVRKIKVPTAANLDFAAYDRNPVLFDPVTVRFKKSLRPVSAADMGFKGVLLNPVQNIGETPLTKEEKVAPIAWKPFIKGAWDVVKNDQLQSLGAAISGYKWADSSVFQPYQQVSALYIHDHDGAVEFWVKVELAPWASFFKLISDEDSDGAREIYGKLNLKHVDPDSLAKTIAWVRHDYSSKQLSREEMTDWVTDLASYWYPTRNTDILELPEDGVWPDKSTQRSVRRELAGLTVTRPLAIIEGKPFSPKKPIYNVFLAGNPVEPVSGPAVDSTEKEPLVQSKIMNVALSDNFRKNNRRFSRETSDFGSYKMWEEANYPFLDGLRAWLTGFPKEQMALEGKEEWLFFRKSLDYILGGDLSLQSEWTNPLPHIIALRNYLDGLGIDMLFVVVPNKEEIYFDRISDSLPLPKVSMVNPYGRKFLADLQQTGVEVIDLLPVYLREKERDSLQDSYLYQQHDTHWSGRGMELTAGLIADRIKKYPWYRHYNDTIVFRKRDTLVERRGDLTERLPDERRIHYKPQKLLLRQVFYPDGTRYKSTNLGSPILLIGDSFTGVFELVDCKSAGVGAHISYRCRIPVDIVTSWGGGPMVRQKMLRARQKYLDRKRVVIYMMVARDLYKYAQGWETLSAGGN
jgi:alginate O-acetyltransferase complex protein AlgJ